MVVSVWSGHPIWTTIKLWDTRAIEGSLVVVSQVVGRISMVRSPLADV